MVTNDPCHLITKTRTYLIVFLCLSNVSMLLGQDESAYADSLLKELKTTTVDTSRVNILAGLAADYMYSNTALALEYGEKGLKLALKVNFQSGVSTCLINIGNTLVITGNYEEAISNYNKALKINRTRNNKKEAATCLSNLGMVQYYLGDIPKAVEFNIEALKMREELNDSIGLCQSLNNLGGLYLRLKKYDKAIAYFEKSLEIKEDIKDWKGVVTTLMNIGSVYVLLEHYEDGIEKYNESIKVCEQSGNDFIIAKCLSNIGEAFRLQGDRIGAINWHKKSVDIKEKLGDKQGIALSIKNISELYLEQGMFFKAIEYNNRGLAVSQEIGYTEGISNGYALFARIYSEQKKYEKAYEYERLHSHYKDSLLDKEGLKQIAELEAKYENEKSKKEIAVLNKKNEVQNIEAKKDRILKYTLSVGIFLLLLIAALIYNRYLLKQRSNRQLLMVNNELAEKNKEIKLQKEKMELKALRSQMNPHFIFNSLNSIQRFIANTDKEKAHDYLSMFGKIIRASLDSSDKDSVPIIYELDNLETYIKLESARIENALNYAVEIDPSIDIYNLQIPPMLIQPYVENAIWHGIAPKVDDGNIIIKMKLTDHKIFCTIEDNGIGREKALELKNEDVRNQDAPSGMKITRDRLAVLWSKRNESLDVNVIDLFDESNNPIGTKIELYLPVDF